MPGYPGEARYYLTGKYRLKPDGNRVILQLEEATRPMQMPDSRWRDATPQDVMSMVGLQIEPASLRIGGGRA